MFRTPLAFFSIEETRNRREKLRIALNDLSHADEVSQRLEALEKATVGGGTSTTVKIGSVRVF